MLPFFNAGKLCVRACVCMFNVVGLVPVMFCCNNSRTSTFWVRVPAYTWSKSAKYWPVRQRPKSCVFEYGNEWTGRKDIPGTLRWAGWTVSVAVTIKTTSDSTTKIKHIQTTSIDDDDVAALAGHSAPCIPRHGDADDRWSSPLPSITFAIFVGRSSWGFALRIHYIEHTQA